MNVYKKTNSWTVPQLRPNFDNTLKFKLYKLADDKS